jgi:hypothetical protein
MRSEPEFVRSSCFDFFVRFFFTAGPGEFFANFRLLLEFLFRFRHQLLNRGSVTCRASQLIVGLVIVNPAAGRLSRLCPGAQNLGDAPGLRDAAAGHVRLTRIKNFTDRANAVVA